MDGQKGEPALLLYATITLWGGKPALVIRRVIRDPRVIRAFAMKLLKDGHIVLPAIVTVSNDINFYSNAKRAGIIK